MIAYFKLNGFGLNCCFHKGSFRHQNAQLTSVGEKDGQAATRTLPWQDFASAIGRPHDQVWDERIANLDIKIDGRLAVAWMDFSFYLGDQLLHCGVNVFDLIRTEEGWKILQITDTRRTEDCIEMEP